VRTKTSRVCQLPRPERRASRLRQLSGIAVYSEEDVLAVFAASDVGDESMLLPPALTAGASFLVLTLIGPRIMFTPSLSCTPLVHPPRRLEREQMAMLLTSETKSSVRHEAATTVKIHSTGNQDHRQSFDNLSLEMQNRDRNQRGSQEQQEDWLRLIEMLFRAQGAGGADLPARHRSMGRQPGQISSSGGKLLTAKTVRSSCPARLSPGFNLARSLATKMTVLYRLSSEQLSKQHHYDFGLRALKSVLVMAGALKRDTPELSEDLVLMRALVAALEVIDLIKHR
jgi:hypothetical protein